MFQMRRYPAALIAAFALVLGACGGNTPTTTSDQAGGSLSDNPLMISLTPGTMVFESATATPPAPQMLMTQGLVAIGSAVEFGAIQYSDAVTPWLHVDPRSTFQRDPLAWLNTVSIDQSAFAGLADGVYTAQIPVIVRAAVNTPQMLNVALCKGSTSCIFPGSDVDAELTVGDPTWDRGSTLNNSGTYPYDDYQLFVPAHTVVSVEVIGGDCDGSYTHEDNYVYVFTTGGAFVSSNDDGGCGNDSYVELTNSTGSPVEYLVRATSYGNPASPSGREYGTYHVKVTSIGAALRAMPTPEPGDKPTVEQD